MKTYKDLIFWKRSKEVSILIIELADVLPKDQKSRIVMSQLLRSGFSVGANICEGYGKYKGKEYTRFLKMALGSANETEYWLELLIDIYPNMKTKITPIIDKNSETIKMLISTVKSLQKQNI